MLRIRSRALALAGAAIAAVLIGMLFQAGPAAAATLEQVTDFGTNPSQLEMYVYRPDSAPVKPALVVSVHYCTGTGPAMFNGTQIGPLADKYGFVVVLPSVTQDPNKCFDVASPAALTRDGGSDPVGIKSMIDYAIANYDVDPARIYVTGVSSGAMMTNVLLGDYPDVFKAGSAFAGVPFGCFAGAYSWNTDCATGLITKTGPEWGDLVRAAYPGYTGPRPRMQLWHGTEDTTLSYHNFGEEIKQWTNVLGVSETPTSTAPDTPTTGTTRTQYANSAGVVQVEAYSMAGVPHNLPVDTAAAIHFFGLDGATSTPTPTVTQTVSPTAPPTATPTVTPTVTPTTVTPPPTTPVTTAPSGSGCTATFTATNSWGSGFIGSVKVTAGSVKVSKWTVGLTVPSGTSIANLWNGVLTGSSVSAAAWNGSLAAGATTEFGFQGSGPPTGVSVASCTAG